MYVHSGVVNKEVGFHTIEPFGVWFHFENFWKEPVSISVKVIFLVDGQHDG
jgi:hypothetical protein